MYQETPVGTNFRFIRLHFHLRHEPKILDCWRMSRSTTGTCVSLYRREGKVSVGRGFNSQHNSSNLYLSAVHPFFGDDDSISTGWTLVPCLHQAAAKRQEGHVMNLLEKSSGSSQRSTFGGSSGCSQFQVFVAAIWKPNLLDKFCDWSPRSWREIQWDLCARRIQDYHASIHI